MNYTFLSLFNPNKIFEEIKVKNTISAASLFVTSLLMLFSLLINAPIKERASTILLLSMNLPADQVDNMVRVMHKMKYFQIFNSEILDLGMLFAYSFVIYVLILLFKNKILYKQILQLVLYIYPIVLFGDILNGLFIYYWGIENITNQYEILMFGVNKLASINSISTTFYTFLSYINPFQIWFIILLEMGVKTLAKTSHYKSVVISSLFWLISTLIPTLSIYISELLRDKAVSIL